MASILYLQNSIFGDQGQSSQLARRFIEGYQAAHPGTGVVVRDLITDGVPHLDLERAGALRGFSDTLNDAQRAVLAQSDSLVEELNNADLVVIGLPMYNFSVPSQFKAWFDHIARAGLTFKYTEQGPVGLVADKPVRVFATHGGIHQGQPHETSTQFVKTILAFIGLTDVEFVYAEGLNIGEDVKNQALLRAQARIAAQLQQFDEKTSA
ncbi:FMN-dependent NADH-azoreductase [Alloalcanivorax mobilis]|uniref:FMN-dependent NADH-azoreductase n=1 Tax=Alloalcanivorax mobilis TaxID=2019569 RepID=UPI000C78FE47|nr:NAD(P)H-dependent oxidoreductase [Alloalcanivorax mobilis]